MKNLNFGEFNSLYDFFEAFPTEAACIAYLESKRWANGVVSPYTQNSKVYRRGDGMYLKSVKRTATLFTDEWCGYALIRKIYNCKMVDHGKHQYVDGDAYTNSIEGFWGNFCKRVVNTIYNHVSRKYMQRYFDEICFRYNSRKVSNKARFDMAISHIGIRVTQNQIVGQ